LSHKDSFHELCSSHKSLLQQTCLAVQYLCQSVDKQTVGTLVAEERSECSVTGRGRVSAVSEKRHLSTVSSITGRRDALISDGWLGSPTWRRQTHGWQRENTCRTQCGVWGSDVTLAVINVKWSVFDVVHLVYTSCVVSAA